jgi:hypothetical protein
VWGYAELCEVLRTRTIRGPRDSTPALKQGVSATGWWGSDPGQRTPELLISSRITSTDEILRHTDINSRVLY